MDFGKIPNFYEVDLSLPQDHPRTAKVLGSAKLSKSPDSQLSFYIGAPMWSHKNFIGKIYPERTQPAHCLNHYCEHFGAIELNTTHYQTPSEQRVKQWTQKVVTNPEFKFCPKFPQTISHFAGDFSAQTQEIEAFLASLSHFDHNLGPTFIQMPPYLDLASASVIKNFISRFPSDIDLAIEFRHGSWFEDNRVANNIFDFLEQKNITTVISDVAGRRDVCHMRLTNKKAFIRFTGNSLHSSDFTRLDEWVHRLESWQQQGLEEVYFFMHQPDESQCVELAQYLKENSSFSFLSPQLLKKIEQLDIFDL